MLLRQQLSMPRVAERFNKTDEDAKTDAGQQQLDDGVTMDIRQKQPSKFVALAVNGLTTVPEGSQEGDHDV